MFDDDGSKDWELKDEKPPQRLQEQWEREEDGGSQTIVCPSCKKETSTANLSCIFCGATIFREKCPGRCFFAWVKRLFTRN